MAKSIVLVVLIAVFAGVALDLAPDLSNPAVWSLVRFAPLWRLS